jgi:hypothetical protein
MSFHAYLNELRVVDKEKRVYVTAVSVHELSKRCLHHFANFIGVYGHLILYK